MATHGSNGAQQPTAYNVPSHCDVCGAVCEHFDLTLCGSHYRAWESASEKRRRDAHRVAGRESAARVAYEDFVRRLRAEETNRAAA